MALSTTGPWYAFVSLPLFQFLLIRWYFRGVSSSPGHWVFHHFGRDVSQLRVVSPTTIAVVWPLERTESAGRFGEVCGW